MYSFRIDDDIFVVKFEYFEENIPDKFEKNNAVKKPPTPKHATK